MLFHFPLPFPPPCASSTHCLEHLHLHSLTHSSTAPCQACLLENTRFHAGDTKNDPTFAARLAQLANVYVCDAFGVVHRDQGSVTVRAVCWCELRL